MKIPISFFSLKIPRSPAVLHRQVVQPLQFRVWHPSPTSTSSFVYFKDVQHVPCENSTQPQLPGCLAMTSCGLACPEKR